MVLAIAGGLWFGLKSPGQTSATPAAEGQVITVQRGDLRIKVTGAGNLDFSDTADCPFQLAGYVDQVLVEAGDPVTKGQVLAQLYQTDWDNEKTADLKAVIQNTISLKNADLTMLNTLGQNPNSASGSPTSVSPLDIEVKRLQLDIARSNLKSAQSTLDDLLATSPKITAPFGGFVTAVNVKGGDEVSKGKIAVSIADPTRFQADVMVNEMDIPQVQVGTRATLEVTSLTSVILTGKVAAISPTATRSGGVVNYAVRVQVDPLISEPRLKQGLSVNLNLIILEKPNVILVPVRAVSRTGRNATVQVVGVTGVDARTVTSGDSDGQYIEVTDGLSAGDKVLIPAGNGSTSSGQQRTTTPRMPGGMFVPRG